jgi:hypothetical protein
VSPVDRTHDGGRERSHRDAHAGAQHRDARKERPPVRAADGRQREQRAPHGGDERTGDEQGPRAHLTRQRTERPAHGRDEQGHRQEGGPREGRRITLNLDEIEGQKEELSAQGAIHDERQQVGPQERGRAKDLQRHHRRPGAALDQHERRHRHRAAREEHEHAGVSDARTAAGVDERVHDERQRERHERRAWQVDGARRRRIARLLDVHQREGDDDRGDRRVDDEQPAPGRVRDHPSPRDRTAGCQDRARRRPRPDRGAPLGGVRIGRRDERQAPGDQQRRAEPLDRSRRDEERGPRSEPARQGGQREQDHAGDEDPPAPEAVAERAAHQHEGRQQQQVGLDDPLRHPHVDGQLALHDGERDVDQRAVQERHARPEHRHEERPARRGASHRAGWSIAASRRRRQSASSGRSDAIRASRISPRSGRWFRASHRRHPASRSHLSPRFQPRRNAVTHRGTNDPTHLDRLSPPDVIKAPR